MKADIDNLTPLEREAILQIDTNRWPMSFENPHSHFEAHCGVVFCEHDNQAVVILVEESDNPGISVTNYIEGLATLLHSRLNLGKFAPENIRWFEHYPARKYSSPTLDRVFLKFDNGNWHSPDWRRITRYLQKAAVPAEAGA